MSYFSAKRACSLSLQVVTTFLLVWSCSAAYQGAMVTPLIPVAYNLLPYENELYAPGGKVEVELTFQFPTGSIAIAGHKFSVTLATTDRMSFPTDVSTWVLGFDSPENSFTNITNLNRGPASIGFDVQPSEDFVPYYNYTLRIAPMSLPTNTTECIMSIRLAMKSVLMGNYKHNMMIFGFFPFASVGGAPAGLEPCPSTYVAIDNMPHSTGYSYMSLTFNFDSALSTDDWISMSFYGSLFYSSVRNSFGFLCTASGGDITTVTCDRGGRGSTIVAGTDILIELLVKSRPAPTSVGFGYRVDGLGVPKDWFAFYVIERDRIDDGNGFGGGRPWLHNISDSFSQTPLISYTEANYPRGTEITDTSMDVISYIDDNGAQKYKLVFEFTIQYLNAYGSFQLRYVQLPEDVDAYVYPPSGTLFLNEDLNPDNVQFLTPLNLPAGTTPATAAIFGSFDAFYTNSFGSYVGITRQTNSDFTSALRFRMQIDNYTFAVGGDGTDPTQWNSCINQPYVLETDHGKGYFTIPSNVAVIQCPRFTVTASSVAQDSEIGRRPGGFVSLSFVFQMPVALGTSGAYAFLVRLPYTVHHSSFYGSLTASLKYGVSTASTGFSIVSSAAAYWHRYLKIYLVSPTSVVAVAGTPINITLSWLRVVGGCNVRFNGDGMVWPSTIVPSRIVFRAVAASYPFSMNHLITNTDGVGCHDYSLLVQQQCTECSGAVPWGNVGTGRYVSLTPANSNWHCRTRNMPDNEAAYHCDCSCP